MTTGPQSFGTTPDGAEVRRVVLASGGLRAAVISWGASIQELWLDGHDRPVALLSAGTDGRDGPTDAAGAWATTETAARARRAGLVPEECLARNDAYPLFHAVGSLLRTGPTHTNVMDVQVALAEPPSAA